MQAKRDTYLVDGTNLLILDESLLEKYKRLILT